jgi:hypothetical protein
MIIGAVALLIAFIVTGVVLGRQSAQRKKEAIESLKAEKASLRTVSILDLAREEIEELGLEHIEGADGLPTDVMLKVWKEASTRVADCDRADLRYVVSDGVDPTQATVKDVTIMCGGDHAGHRRADAVHQDDASVPDED